MTTQGSLHTTDLIRLQEEMSLEHVVPLLQLELMVSGELGLFMEPAAPPAEVARKQELGVVTALHLVETEQLVLG